MDEKIDYDLQELLSYLNLFEDEYLSKPFVQEQIIQELDSSTLMQRLTQIKMYCSIEQTRKKVLDFLFIKFKNLLNLFRYDRSATFYHYLLLYDILQAICQTNQTFLHKFLESLYLSILTKRDEDKFNLHSSFLLILCLILITKYQIKLDKINPIQIIKELSFNNQKIITMFIIKLIKQKMSNDFTQFSFIKERVSYQSYDKLIFPKNRNKSITHTKIKEMNRLPIVSATKVQIKSKQQNFKQALSYLNDKIELKETQMIKCKQKVKVITQMDLSQIKKMANYKDILGNLLNLSFSFDQLLEYSIKISLLLLEIQQFTKIIKNITKNKPISFKTKVMSELKKYGIDVQYIGRKLN